MVFNRVICQFRPLVRHASQTSRDAIRKSVEERQKLMQLNNDIPVHLKGGFFDQVLMRTTALMCTTGVLLGLYTVGRLIRGKK
ncbi:cytochrome c oxidase subunit 7A1, mitochondrial-like [Anthonomus grandis grandis]|uniref:cytochrome c oxidase subunit 7A1, mitochondrial-like n=1 Tax=Anthonomus grandis grandis TaxID=2921223 RepID=UPI0021655C54|nr:cytochrome c oxidase subunit 7A1, mitochondrial-like [Anthonomus grandis grandis]